MEAATWHWPQFYMAVLVVIGMISVPVGALKQKTSVGASVYCLVGWALVLLECCALAVGGFW